MVVEGKGEFQRKGGKKKRAQPDRPSSSPFIGKIAALKRQDSRDQALDLLHEIATTVSPVMKFYGLKVGLLCEMYPKDASLLGLNVNMGSKICIRLRPANNKNWFLPMNELIGTMLHELVHNTQGPHNDVFYSTLKTYEDKYYEVQTNGSYKATGYFMESGKLGRGSLPGNYTTVREARLKKLSKPLYVAKVARLGSLRSSGNTQTPRDYRAVRKLAFEAAERRLKDNKACPSQMSQEQIVEVIPDDDELELQEGKAPKEPEVIVID